MHKKLENIIRKILHALECIIAVLTLLVLVALLGLEIYRFIAVPGYIEGVDSFLHCILTIVVGLEFVRMLVAMTPATTLEVLIVAISRQVIVTPGAPWSNIACVVCIAGLFAIRRFLIPKQDLTVEMSEVEPDSPVETEAKP